MSDNSKEPIMGKFKQTKDVKIAARITSNQHRKLQALVDSGKAKNFNEAIEIVINSYSTEQ